MPDNELREVVILLCDYLLKDANAGDHWSWAGERENRLTDISCASRTLKDTLNNAIDPPEGER